MPRKKTNNTELIQVLVTPEIKEAIGKVADLRNTTISEVLRQEIVRLISAVQSGRPAA